MPRVCFPLRVRPERLDEDVERHAAVDGAGRRDGPIVLREVVHLQDQLSQIV